MRHVLSSIVVCVVLATCVSTPALAVGRDKAMYVCGTLSGIKQRTEGRFNTQPGTALAFSAGRKGSIAIPYSAIASLEARSGKTVTFQDAETCRQYKTPKECEGKSVDHDRGVHGCQAVARQS
jgi:hypothetical protein